MFVFRCLSHRKLIPTLLERVSHSQCQCSVSETSNRRRGLISWKRTFINVEQYSFVRSYNKEMPSRSKQKRELITQLQTVSRNKDPPSVDVLDEARYRLGYPNWLSMFKNCFLSVSVNAGPEDFSNLLTSFIERCFLNEDFETECLIVLLVSTLAEKLARYKQSIQDSEQPSLSTTYDDFGCISNPGHVSLANSLVMMRILLLVQQLITEEDNRQTLLTEADDNESVTCTGNNRIVPSPVVPCSKLNKVRVLLSDLFISAMFKEAAKTENPLILQYSFQAMSTAIEGMFLDPVMPRTDKVKTFSTLLREEDVCKTGYCNEVDGHFEKVASNTKNNKSRKFETGTVSRNVNSNMEYSDKCHSSSGKSKRPLRPIGGQATDSPLISDSKFVKNESKLQGLYEWGWTEDLGVICQGCVAVSGLQESIQQDAFKFGRTFSSIRQMKWYGTQDSNQEEINFSRIKSYLSDFPECANKRLLISLCKSYIKRSSAQENTELFTIKHKLFS